jgi:hypothetical protein
MRSYLLPTSHPARDALGILFGRPDVIDNDSTFQAAGFEIRVKQSRSLMRVAAHPALPEYLFKVYFVDERLHEREKPRGWSGFARRCQNAERIYNIIRENGLQYFQVPRKWLFLLPAHHSACSPDDQPVILVAERQDLVSRAENEQAWLNAIAERHLDELHTIIQGAGGSSYRPDNIPMTKQGKFTFIDTEHAGDQPDYESIRQYLSSRMRQYWLTLTNESLVQSTQQTWTVRRHWTC